MVEAVHQGHLRAARSHQGQYRRQVRRAILSIARKNGKTALIAWRKLPFKKMLLAIWSAANCAKGKAALQLSRELGVQYKTAWVLLMKLREVVAACREDMVLEDEVEIDGKYAGGHVRPENKAEEPVDRRLKENRSPNDLCALAIRQRGFLGRTYTRSSARRTAMPPGRPYATTFPATRQSTRMSTAATTI